MQKKELLEQIGKLNMKIASSNKELEDLELEYKNTDTSTAATCIRVSPASDVMTADTNIFYRSHVSAATSALPVTRSAWWNSANGSVWMSSKRFPIGISCSVFPRFFAGIFCMIENCLPPSAARPGNP